MCPSVYAKEIEPAPIRAGGAIEAKLIALSPPYFAKFPLPVTQLVT